MLRKFECTKLTCSWQFVAFVFLKLWENLRVSLNFKINIINKLIHWLGETNLIIHLVGKSMEKLTQTAKMIIIIIITMIIIIMIIIIIVIFQASQTFVSVFTSSKVLDFPILYHAYRICKEVVLMHVFIVLFTIKFKVFLHKSKFFIAVIIKLSFPIIPVPAKLKFT